MLPTLLGALTTLLPLVAAADSYPTLNFTGDGSTGPKFYTCQPVTFSWTVTPDLTPATITLVKPVGRFVAATLATNTTETSVTWLPNIPIGTFSMVATTMSRGYLQGVPSTSPPYNSDLRLFEYYNTGDNSCFSPPSCSVNLFLNSEKKCVTAANCPAGTFGNKTTFTCAPCAANAATCTSATVATSCVSPYLLSSGSCCPSGSFMQNGPCTPCSDPFAATCTATATQTCQDGHLLNMLTSTCTADSSCPSGTYKEGTTRCRPCPSGAVTCDPGKPFTCVDGRFYNSNMNDCVLCGPNIKTCLSATTATACADGYYLSSGKCVASCPSGTFVNNGSCVSCGSNASSCSSATVATACNSPYLLDSTGACVADCGAGYFADSGKCQSCSANAATCSSAGVTTSCIDPYVLKDGACVQPAPVCATGMYLQGDVCTPCSDQYAATCTADKVLTCQGGHNLVTSTGVCTADASCPPSTTAENGASTCTPCPPFTLSCDRGKPYVCAEGAYLDAATLACQLCGPNAKLCSSSSVATACLDGYYLSNGKCVASCPSATFVDNGKCTSCGSNASSCSSATVATACASPYLLDSTGACVAECGAGSFGDSGKCQSCSANAATCSSADVALSCTDLYYLSSNSTCTSDCGDGQFGDLSSGTGKCASCAENALKCTSATAATECQDEFFLAVDGSCGSTCSDGFFANTDSKKCEVCGPNVKTCTSATVATKCSGRYVLAYGMCDRETCPDDMYHKDDGICKSCGVNVLRCASDTEPEACREGHVLYESSCDLTSCPSGTFEEAGACKKCSDEFAATCNSEQSLTCQSGHYLVASTSACTADASCPSATYLDDDKSSCVSCGAHAAACTATGATACEGEYVLYQNACASKFCPTSFFSQGGVCTACSDPNASVCTADKSVTCLSGHKLVQSTSTCTTSPACPSATYDDGNGSCVSCSANAASCTSSGTTKCAGSYVLHDGQCAATSCPTGMRNQDGVCAACTDPNAASCTAFATLSCRPNHLLVTSTNKCTVSNACPTTTYLDGTNCKPCGDGEYTCTATTALTCYQPPTASAPYYLYQGRCISATQCRSKYLLLFASFKPTTQPDGTKTYECKGCAVPNLFDSSKCLV